MNKEWVTQQETEHEKAIAEKRETIVSMIESSDLFDADEKAKMLTHLKEMEEDRYSINKINLDLMLAAITADEEAHDKISAFKKELDTDKYHGMLRMKGGYDRYLDSEPQYFDGDIIITDPCYVCKDDDESQKPQPEDFEVPGAWSKAYDEWREANPRHWDLCEFGYNMEVFGFTNYMTRDTLYGDWGCTTYDSDTKSELGHFCADAGLVSVFLLDEVLRYNPEFDYHEKRTWTTTWIRNFKGTVQFVVVREEGFYKEDTEWWKAGDKWVEYAVRVVGRGVNKVTGEPINFITSQSSL